MNFCKGNANSSNSPLQSQKGKEIMSEVRERCLKRSRKYTLKDLNELRHLKSCRLMPQNILSPTEILSEGFGLCVVTTNSLSTTKEVRLKQIQIAQKLDGYNNYINLIPNKNERIRNVHPMTPTISEIVNLSKRNFDKKIKYWKKELHRWDAITSVSEIPHYLLTDSMLNERNMMRSTHHHHNHRNQLQFWSPKGITKSMNRSNISENHDYEDDDETQQCVTKLIFDDDDKKDQKQMSSVYSPSKNKWYKLKNCSNSKVQITRNSAVECLKMCISNVRLKECEGSVSNRDDLDELIMEEFSGLLQQMFI